MASLASLWTQIAAAEASMAAPRVSAATGIRVDEREVRRLLELIGDIRGGAKRVMQRTVADTLKKGKSVISKDIAQRTGIAQYLIAGRGGKKATRGRVYIRDRSRRSLSGDIWVGVRDMPASRLGTVKKTKDGYKAGKFYLPGAFEATMPSGHTDIYQRVIPGRRRTEGRPRSSSPNLPIKKAAVPLQYRVAYNIDLREYYVRRVEQLVGLELEKLVRRRRRA